MKIILFCLTIFIILSIFSCKNNNTNKIIVDDNNKISKLYDFFENPFLNFKLNENEDDIIKKLGIPIEKQKYLGSPRCSIVDTTGDISKLKYDGLNIELFNDCEIQHILITNNKYKLKYNIKIGSKKDYIYKLFIDNENDLMNNLDEVKNGTKLIYSIDPCREIIYYFDNNILTKIEL